MRMDRRGVIIRGTGRCVPSRVVTNEEFSRKLDTTDDWIRTRTGIRERRIAATTDTAASLGTEAAWKALDAARLTPRDIDLIICATVTPDFACPATANVIQAQLGCRTIPSFDLTAACTGFLYGLHVAEQFVRAGTATNVLLIGSELLSRVFDPTDRNTAILFGDGAGAIVVGAGDPGSGIHRVRLYSDGSRPELISVPSIVTPEANRQNGPYLAMNGREVFKFAVTKMTELISQAQLDCGELGLTLDMIVPHQVNRRIVDAAVEATGYPAERIKLNLDHFGNTSAASVPIALDEVIRDGQCASGQTILLAAFGGGLTWGSAIVTL
jgi:3-oxoacyl-[acyl-carrier-protein] synthase-3